MTEWPAADFYRGRRVMVTGGTGFIGLNLIRALQQLNAEIRVLARSDPPAESQEDVARVTVFRADLRDAPVVRKALDGCSVVFNLAAHSGSTTSNLEPFEDLDVNLRAQLTLLEESRRLEPLPTIVFPSSRLVYRPTQNVPVPETALTGPLSLYGVHKLAAEHYHLLYQQLYGVRPVILRITNAYGPLARATSNRYGIINWFIHLAVTDQVLPIYGDGHQLRDYIHVDDVVAAFLLAGSSPRAAGATFNLGSGRGVSFRKMAETVVEAAGGGRIEQQPWPEDAARVETGDFVADITRIKQTLAWEPAIALETGLRRVVGQYRQMEKIR